MAPSFYRRVPAILAAVLCLTISSVAQESRATLTGRVSDPAGAAVPNATVIVKNQQTNIRPLS